MADRPGAVKARMRDRPIEGELGRRARGAAAAQGDHRAPKMIKVIIDVRKSKLAIEDGRMIILGRRAGLLHQMRAVPRRTRDLRADRVSDAYGCPMNRISGFPKGSLDSARMQPQTSISGITARCALLEAWSSWPPSRGAVGTIALPGSSRGHGLV